MHQCKTSNGGAIRTSPPYFLAPSFCFHQIISNVLKLDQVWQSVIKRVIFVRIRPNLKFSALNLARFMCVLWAAFTPLNFILLSPKILMLVPPQKNRKVVTHWVPFVDRRPNVNFLKRHNLDLGSHVESCHGSKNCPDMSYAFGCIFLCCDWWYT